MAPGNLTFEDSAITNLTDDPAALEFIGLLVDAEGEETLEEFLPPTGAPTTAAAADLVVDDNYPDSWFYGYVAATVVLFMAFILALCFGTSLLLSKKVRRNAFDLYVLLIIIPDALLVGETAVTTLQKIAVGKDVPEKPRHTLVAQSIHDFLQPFYYVANFYLNAIIINEIFNMIQSAQAMRRYTPPPIRKVLFQSLAVYTFSGIYSLWWVLPVPWAATHRDPETGRLEGPGSEVFSERAVTIIHFCLLAIPVTYIFGVFGYIRFKGLLQPTGRTRQLYLYFMRIILVYILFYIPGVIINYVKETWTGHGDFFAGLVMDFLFPLQTMVTIYLALKKEDIKVAWKKFWACRCCEGGLDESDVYALDISTRRPTKRGSTFTAMVDSTSNTIRRFSRWSPGTSGTTGSGMSESNTNTEV